MIDSRFRNIDSLFFLLFKTVNNHPRIYTDKYYMLLVKIIEINILIDNKLFFD